MSTITYQRLDGSTFEYHLFHRQMEHAGVVDPRDGKLKVFKTFYDSHGTPLKRIEMRMDEDGNLHEV